MTYYNRKQSVRDRQTLKAGNKSRFKKFTFEFLFIKYLFHRGHCDSYRGGRGKSQHFCGLRTLSDGGGRVKCSYKRM